MSSVVALSPDQPVLHRGRRATFLHLSRGEAIIRYWGGSHAVSVPLEALSLPPAKRPRVKGTPGGARRADLSRAGRAPAPAGPPSGVTG